MMCAMVCFVTIEIKKFVPILDCVVCMDAVQNEELGLQFIATRHVLYGVSQVFLNT